jgi:hypothetical protein
MALEEILFLSSIHFDSTRRRCTMHQFCCQPSNSYRQSFSGWHHIDINVHFSIESCNGELKWTRIEHVGDFLCYIYIFFKSLRVFAKSNEDSWMMGGCG